jgi:hypothetical protein
VPAVNRKLFCRRRAERFARLLDEANGVGRHHVRSPVDDDLARLLAVGRRARDLQTEVEVDPDFRAGLRAMLLATAEREGIGATASPGSLSDETPRRSSATGSGHGLFHPALGGQRARARGAILVGVAAGAIAVSGMSAASENAVPGDALYGMKRSTERAQLALASSDLSRGQLFLDFAQTRLAEAKAVREDSVGLASVLNDMDADTTAGAKLLTTSAAERRDEAALDAIGRFLNSQRQQVSELLDGAGPAERDRTVESLTLLDSIKKRADGLRVSMHCGAAPAARADDLGPLPQACQTSKGLPSAQLSPPTERRPGSRTSDPSQAENNHPPSSRVTPATPAGPEVPKMTKPIDGRPAN